MSGATSKKEDEMSTIPADVETSNGNLGIAKRIIDCDVHPHFDRGLQTLAPYVSKPWAKKLGLEERPAWAANVSNVGFGLPKNESYVMMSGSIRMDAVPDDGSAPVSNPREVAQGYLDPLGIERAVLLNGSTFGLGSGPNADAASVIATATNDWLADVWLSSDERYRGAIVVAPQDPASAAAEIRRMAENQSVVEVLVASNNVLMGDPSLYPIYDAASECGLPVTVHPCGTESIYANAPLLSGIPWYHVQWHTTLTLPHQANAVSLVAHGVFEKFPNLHVVFTEVGVAWLLDVMWRMDKNWKGLRDEVPWVKRLPSEYMIEHFRFTTQPFLEPKKREHLAQFIEMIDGDRILMFSTDYPHWDGDSLSMLKTLPRAIRDRVAFQNAADLFGSRLGLAEDPAR
jgi:uncharacterized protein